jgi:Zn-dependent oligopeptidase
MAPDTAFIAYFGHIIGYSAGYYGYAWADAISADMATVFENAPDRFFDKEAGTRLRREIYEPGDSRDVNISIEKFLGRERSLEPFLESIGIGKSKSN